MTVLLRLGGTVAFAAVLATVVFMLCAALLPGSMVTLTGVSVLVGLLVGRLGMRRLARG